MLQELTDKDISLDGDLLLYTKDGDPRAAQSESEKELITVFAKIMYWLPHDKFVMILN